MVGARYSRGEVLFLVSLTHQQAVELDAFPRDSCADLSDDDISSGCSEEELPVIARWADVQRVKRELVREKESLAMVQLRASGFSETEIARLSGRDRLAVRRRWHATISEITDRLNVGLVDESAPVLSIVSACLKCGERPRVRLVATRRRVRGGWKEIQPERQASVCEVCITPELRDRILVHSVAVA